MKELILAVLTWPTVGQNTGGFYFGPAAEKTGGECTDNKEKWSQVYLDSLICTHKDNYIGKRYYYYSSNVKLDYTAEGYTGRF